MMKNVLKLIVAMQEKLCEYAESHELYTINERIMWYVNSISVSYFKRLLRKDLQDLCSPLPNPMLAHLGSSVI